MLYSCLKAVSVTLLTLLLFSLLLSQQTYAYTTNMNASVVVGQQNFTSGSANQGGSTGASTLNMPYSGYTDGTKFFVADNANNRVLIYNSIPTSNTPSANVVIGQTNFTNNSANQGGSADANTLSAASDVLVVGGKLLVVDPGNNRILVFNSIPTSNNASANVVIGQPNMTTVSTGTTASKLSGPWGGRL